MVASGTSDEARTLIRAVGDLSADKWVFGSFIAMARLIFYSTGGNILILLLYAIIASKRSGTMSWYSAIVNFLQTNKDTIPTAIAILGVFGAVAAFLWNQWLAVKARHLEAQRPFLEKQLALYFETAALNGRLSVTPPTDSEWVNIEKRFWQLYWSELSMVEAKAVEYKMVALGRAMRDYKSDPENDEKREVLHLVIYAVAHAIRDSISASWQTKS